jgi:hypothetical protein
METIKVTYDPDDDISNIKALKSLVFKRAATWITAGEAEGLVAANAFAHLVRAEVALKQAKAKQPTP